MPASKVPARWVGLLLVLLPFFAATAALATGCLDRDVPDRYAGSVSGGVSGGATDVGGRGEDVGVIPGGPGAGRRASRPGAGGASGATVGAAPIVSWERVTGNFSVPSARDRGASGGSGYEADTVLAVRYGTRGGYERVVLDLGAGDEPAGKVPAWSVASHTRSGLLRLTLPSVGATGASDGRLGEAGDEDALLRSFHVVRDPGGGMFVDVSARDAFASRVVGLRDPARLVVDFEPTGEPLAARALRAPRAGGDTVLVEPRAGDRIDGALTVSGYSRNPGAANEVVLLDAGGEVLARRTVEGNDWRATWGYFEATLDPPPFSGKGTLKVGAGDDGDGPFRGVEIPVRGAPEKG